MSNEKRRLKALVADIELLESIVNSPEFIDNASERTHRNIYKNLHHRKVEYKERTGHHYNGKRTNNM